MAKIVFLANNKIYFLKFAKKYEHRKRYVRAYYRRVYRHSHMVRVGYSTLRTVTQQLLLRAPPYYHTTKDSSKCYNMLHGTP